MKSIAIIGHGYVGQAMSRLFSEHYEIIIKGKEDTPSWDIVNACDLKIVCVPTKMNDDGSCDTSIVQEVSKKLKGLVLIKSTIVPGTTKKLNLENSEASFCFSPEYVGEGKYFIPYWKYPHPTDMKMHDFMIVGGSKEDAERVINFFVPVMGTHVKYHITDSTTAEAVKYMENTWGAMKVTFCNEWYDICDKLEISYVETRQLWLLDSRVEPMHTAVFPDKRGFSGKCFPKDLSGITEELKSRGYTPEILETIIKKNKEFQSRNV